MAARVAEMGVNTDKIHFIPNWANPKVIYPVPPDKNSLRQELGLNDKFVVLYSGNMGVSHNFDDILEVIERCQDDEGLHFVFIGGGQRRREIENFIEKKHPQNVTLLPFQPLERLAESLSLGDVHFISLREGFDRLVVPSKFYGALAAGRAVIYQGNEKSEIARTIRDEGIGKIIPSHVPDDLEKAIRTYRQAPTMALQQGRKAHQLSQEKLSMHKTLSAYFRVITKAAYA
jgi:glycosyltransferase involved in cell wall biosynthesis